MADINTEIYLTTFCIDVNIYEFRNEGAPYTTGDPYKYIISSQGYNKRTTTCGAIRLQRLSENIKEIQKSIYKRR